LTRAHPTLTLTLARALTLTPGRRGNRRRVPVLRTTGEVLGPLELTRESLTETGDDRGRAQWESGWEGSQTCTSPFGGHCSPHTPAYHKLRGLVCVQTYPRAELFVLFTRVHTKPFHKKVGSLSLPLVIINHPWDVSVRGGCGAAQQRVGSSLSPPPPHFPFSRLHFSSPDVPAISHPFRRAPPAPGSWRRAPLPTASRASGASASSFSAWTSAR